PSRSRHRLRLRDAEPLLARRRRSSAVRHARATDRRDSGPRRPGSAETLPGGDGLPRRVPARAVRQGDEMSHDDLCWWSARDLAAAIRARDVSAREVMAAHLAPIAEWNPRLNAIVAKLDDDACLALAADADQRLARGEAVGPLHGLPFAFKD